MHPIMQQRVEGLKALRDRGTLAPAELYDKIGMDQPATSVRYQVVPKGESAYHIVELATGKTRGFRFSYKAAVDYAKQLEVKAESKARAQ
ncbi:hypothetical protein N5D52_27380 [Pseudomonas sp. GD03860]|uniref:hypothetical protein n=1 Tax=Pseudomonas sp. GD03860 TaxID=2975389 RepID=UPI002446C6B7|nr:hypothetical protein [Pseudomonas sp. GD03860]MDH0640651.1 hypothetical protein [Pseudomonas sp. GD03860]